MAPAAVQFLVFGAIIYGVNTYGMFMRQNVINPKLFFEFFLRDTFFIALICVFGGSGLIANDLKNNALQLYLSKPITRMDYLAGKMAIMMVLMGCITIIPGILLFTENAVISQDLTFLQENYWLLGSIALYSLILMIPTGFLILALSSATRNSRYAAITFLAILIGTPIIKELLREVFRIKSAAFVSYWSNLDILGRRLFGLPGEIDNWYWAMFIMLGIIGLSVWIMLRRVKGVEIVK